MRKVFISYARAEDVHLSSVATVSLASYKVSWDKTSTRSPSLTFLHEIREAIHAADHVLVIVGPWALRSRYVQQEWQYALSIAKIVIPVLRLDTMHSLPPELAILQAGNFQSESFEAEFPRLLDDLRAEPPRLGQLYGDVPEPPAHYRPRPSVMSELAMRVTRDLHKPVGGTPGNGAPWDGGLGKTVTAASYARMTGGRRIFSDGIVWLSFETAPTPLAVLQMTGNALAPDVTRYGDNRSAMTYLREALAE